MPMKVSETAAQYVAAVLEQVQENEDSASVNLGKVTVRIPEETISLLDYVGGRLRLSRSALAAELLCRSVEEAVLIVGIPSEEDGFQMSFSESGSHSLEGAA